MSPSTRKYPYLAMRVNRHPRLFWKDFRAEPGGIAVSACVALPSDDRRRLEFAKNNRQNQWTGARIRVQSSRIGLRVRIRRPFRSVYQKGQSEILNFR